MSAVLNYVDVYSYVFIGRYSCVFMGGEGVCVCVCVGILRLLSPIF